VHDCVIFVHPVLEIEQDQGKLRANSSYQVDLCEKIQRLNFGVLVIKKKQFALEMGWLGLEKCKSDRPAGEVKGSPELAR